MSLPIRGLRACPPLVVGPRRLPHAALRPSTSCRQLLGCCMAMGVAVRPYVHPRCCAIDRPSPASSRTCRRDGPSVARTTRTSSALDRAPGVRRSRVTGLFRCRDGRVPAVCGSRRARRSPSCVLLHASARPSRTWYIRSSRRLSSERRRFCLSMLPLSTMGESRWTLLVGLGLNAR